MLSLEPLFAAKNVYCLCGKTLNRSTHPSPLEDAYHLETCRHGGWVIARHDAVKNCLVRILRERGIQCKAEPRISDEDNKRGDVYIPALVDNQDRKCMVDISIANVGTEDALKNLTPLAAATAREEAKHAKHDAGCMAGNTYLAAAILENTGALNKETRELYNSVALIGGRGATDTFRIGREMCKALLQANAEAIVGLISSLGRPASAAASS